MKEGQKKASSNYALELSMEPTAEGVPMWAEINKGFISPEKALEWATAQKVEGTFRVVRIASEVYSGQLVTNPVYKVIQLLIVKKVSKIDKTPASGDNSSGELTE